MLDLFGYAFMQRALISGVVIGAVCAIIGVYVVLKGLAFIGTGIAHASFGGVALGFLLRINLVLSALVFCLATAMGIGWVSRKGQVKEDSAIGMFFSAAMAMGILFVGLLKGYNVDLFGYLFGSILAVTTADLWMSVGLGVLVIGVVFLFYKELLIVAFDTETAKAMGLPVERLYFLLLALMAATVVVSIKVVGIVLVEALIVTPAAAAYQLSDDFPKMMALSLLFGVASTIVGLVLSFYINTASGATIVLTSTAIFFVALAASPRRRQGRLLSRASVARSSQGQEGEPHAHP
jgi:ABC-type Mn2+/Zn2+ transport system permease subunit